MGSLDIHSTMQVPTFQSYLLGAPVEELTHAATAYLDVGLTFVPRLRHRHQPADLSNGPHYSSDLLDLFAFKLKYGCQAYRSQPIRT